MSKTETDNSMSQCTMASSCQNSTVLTRIISENGEPLGDLLELPRDITNQYLQYICTALLNKEPSAVFAFFVNGKEILTDLSSVLDGEKLSTESIVDIVCQEQASFKVRPVTRCTSSLPGHAEAVISVQFSPDSKCLASGSGDTTVRLWDIHTQTPKKTCCGHKNWVLCLAWSPNGFHLASGCKNGDIIVWDAATGDKKGPVMTGHKQWITGLVWEPYHLNECCTRFASSGKDGTIRIWDLSTGRVSRILSSHTQSITNIKWGGSGLIYSSSQDRTIKVWRAKDGVLCRTLQGHGHWVNTLALNTDYFMRTSCIEFSSEESSRWKAESKYSELVKRTDGEILVSGSDDFTLFLWYPEKGTKAFVRMTGHQQLINCVQFSPDARLIASASFDKSVKLWNGTTGKFIATLRGHVQAVYMVSWSSDSRLLVSGSADSTLKVWDVKTQKLAHDLPGHADEVFAVDWSPDGEKVVSGGKDKVLKLWQN